MKKSKIVGIGHYVPENVITNEYLSTKMATSDEWITERTGIKERRFFTLGEDTVANMGTRATKLALERAGLQAKDIDFIVFATITPDYYFPGSGVLLGRELELEGIPALDIRNQCSGFVYALSIADQFIRTGMYKTILVVGSEIQSSILNISDEGRGMAVIFGDGAGAVILQATEEEGKGILSTHLHADGRFAEELIVKAPSSSMPNRRYPDVQQLTDLSEAEPYMNGNAVFKHAVTRLNEAVQEALSTNNYTADDIDLLVPHQANARITNYLRDTLKLPENKVVSNIHKYGNTTAASIPIAMSEAWAEGRIKENDLICLAAFGSGFTWASALIRW
ncbi:3-oxoacyl-[acyl-carrier-protein] synthase-3 [Flexibacter flexilis DSM 6793]|uniref:Beta-ketoacyl-[acyl-carrier-protein] synthase III n=1 Tax=Flexibacter flexilis DSM 6793 TaxID=927664 RepID=A0A1I1DHI9_9BACT|nr:beta-ketoacyl-ACP synthase III [Flexibacter flexilis]SFB73886.1 3-oxoacyl-[acyl-carrier-protein] synthase-3 [Flexibacter flexilis DSM 6793]